MSIHIELDKPLEHFYTSLDIISGKVVLSVPREETFTAITVKLECESLTRLAADQNDGGRPRVMSELHKLLYHTQEVFPTPEMARVAANIKSPAYLLQPGVHQFPFKFKFPFNTACAEINSILTLGQDNNKHSKQMLPPTLNRYPAVAMIDYFVKVTAQRPSIFRENYRHQLDIFFTPVENPRPPPNGRESYARRQHEFTDISSGQTALRRSRPSSGPPPRINIDGRLPDPPILTIREAIPLRILIKKVNETPELVFLKSFHLVLVSYTRIKAQHLERVEQDTWVIASNANLSVPLGNSNTPVGKDIEIDKSMWASNPIPKSVLPKFNICNIQRWYELRIEVGLGWGTIGNVKPETSIQALRMPVEVYSGLKPPDHVLAEMGLLPNQIAQRNPSSLLSPQPNMNSGPSTPSASQQRPTSASQQFQSVSTAAAAPIDPEGPVDDPPPSYEDAIAEDLQPADGSRRNYDQSRNNDSSDSPFGQTRSKGDRLFEEG